MRISAGGFSCAAMGCPGRLSVAASASSGRSRRREDLMAARRVVILMALCVVSGRCMFAPPLILRLSLLRDEPARPGAGERRPRPEPGRPGRRARMRTTHCGAMGDLWGVRRKPRVDYADTDDGRLRSGQMERAG